MAMLRIQAEQTAEDGPGWCRLRLDGLDHRFGPVELMFRRAGGSRNYLARSGWADSEEWLELPAARDGTASVVRLGPPLTLALGKVSTVEVRARVPGGPDQRTRMAWPRIVLPAENDAASMVERPAEPRVAPPVATVIPPAPKPPDAQRWKSPPPRAQAPSVQSSSGRSATTYAGIGIAGVLLLVILLAAVMTWRSEPNPVLPAPAPARTFTEDSVRAFLADNSDGPSATAEAALYEAAGHPDLALLLYRHAARQGELKAALAIGRMYDPEGFDASRSAFAAPDAAQAARYYEQGAEAGDAEAQYRLGRLLLSGRTGGDSDAERGALWLRRAAGQGHAQARAALAALQKQEP
ncbi:MAG: hypothetical protein K0S81_3619 [Rhodospirillales bacterium]|nr:hypothetical protein [Rhodospirillales bacterium]